MKIKSVELDSCYIVELENGEVYRRTDSMFWEKWVINGGNVFPLNKK